MPVACHVTPPAVALRTEIGTVRAGDTKTAERLAVWLEELVPRIRALVPGTNEMSPDVWLQSRIRLRPFDDIPDNVNGITVGTDRILLRASDRELRETMCHELVHHSLAPEWETLPTIIEEGLCEAVSERIASRDRTRFRVGRLHSALHAFGGFQGKLVVSIDTGTLGHVRDSIPFRAHDDQPPGVPIHEAFALQGGMHDVFAGRLGTRHYAVGYWIVERILQRRGFEGLHALAMRAVDEKRGSIPAEWIYDAAALPPESSAWARLIVERLTHAELRELARSIAPSIAERTAMYLDRNLPADYRLSPELAEVEIKLHLRYASHRIDLLALPEFREVLTEQLNTLERLHWRRTIVAADVHALQRNGSPQG